MSNQAIYEPCVPEYHDSEQLRGQLLSEKNRFCLSDVFVIFCKGYRDYDNSNVVYKLHYNKEEEELYSIDDVLEAHSDGWKRRDWESHYSMGQVSALDQLFRNWLMDRG